MKRIFIMVILVAVFSTHSENLHPFDDTVEKIKDTYESIRNELIDNQCGRISSYLNEHSKSLYIEYIESIQQAFSDGEIGLLELGGLQYDFLYGSMFPCMIDHYGDEFSSSDIPNKDRISQIFIFDNHYAIVYVQSMEDEITDKLHFICSSTGRWLLEFQ